jgi:hypothetical protein
MRESNLLIILYINTQGRERILFTKKKEIILNLKLKQKAHETEFLLGTTH